MKQTLCVLACALMTLGLSCKPRKSQDSAAKRYQYDDGKCASEADPTSCRLKALTVYGQHLLSSVSEYDDVQNIASRKIFEEYNIPANERDNVKLPGVTLLKDSYTIGPSLGSTCFDNDSNTNMYWRGWFSGDQLKGPKKQVEALAEFVAEHHALRGGINDGPFAIHSIEFCPVSVLKARMTLSGSTLKIGLPKNGSNHGFYTAQQIKDMWDSGEFFLEWRGSTAKDAPSASDRLKDVVDASKKVFLGEDDSGKRLWMALNPAGNFRVGLRKKISLTAKNRAQELLATASRLFGAALNSANGQSKVEEAPVTEFLSTVLGIKLTMPNRNLTLTKEDNIPKSRSVFSNAITPETIKMLQSVIVQQKLPRFIKEWECQMQSPPLSNRASEMAQSIVCNSNNESTQVRYRLTGGGVTVANFHEIDVCADFSFGAQREYTAELKKEERPESKTFSYDVESDAKVNVVTGDKVSVKALMDIGTASVSKTVESISFVTALRATLGSGETCLQTR